MIRSFYGIEKYPFSTDDCKLLEHQDEICETLRVHCHQGGLCVILGIPGTGKTRIKEHLQQNSDHKRMLVVTVSRTLHTYTNTIRILCQAFNIEFDGSHFKCEKRLIEEAYSLNRQGKSLVIVIDDAHLLEMQTLRRLRLLFEDFPKNHNVILIGQPVLMGNLALSVNEDIKSRVTYSTVMRRLNPDAMQSFILAQLDRVGLGHNIFTEEALDLIVRSVDGVLRRARNLCLSCMLEAYRKKDKTIDLEIVNKVLIQPHWRKDAEIEHY